MILGSKTFCTEFINSNVSSVPGKRTLYQLIVDPDRNMSDEDWAGDVHPTLSSEQQNFLNSVRFIYNFVLKSVSANVINALIDQVLPGSVDEDRADILVFIVIISVLFGDSRAVIKRWYSLLDLDAVPADLLKDLAPMASYLWVDIYNASSDFNEKQRQAMRAAAEVMRFKGSFDAFIECIKDNAFLTDVSASVDLTKIKILESDETMIGNRVVVITSPYTLFRRDLQTFRYMNMNVYTRALLTKLEELRPAGVFLYFVSPESSLEQLNVWYHVYKPSELGNFKAGTFPADSLKLSVSQSGEITWTSIALLMRVFFNDSMRDYIAVYQSFRELPISTVLCASRAYCRNNSYRNPEASGISRINYINGDTKIGYYSPTPNIMYDMFLPARCDFVSPLAPREYLPVDYENVVDRTDTGTIDDYDDISNEEE